ncbi:hypothetical protein [Paenibacillus roseipurpureus]|uniref:Uncharacterized protein n=1 Tax=Paenibacillus roseopurpureus TaxID=2918901 RepID=A0AA96LI55_9BACL|nr:hypothetical protein [Paenibacillus sp. MBLB1832]WNR42137.1 hypothetical protein MJB10_13420 [Paenibacillus sp. MBLB1832]
MGKWDHLDREQMIEKVEQLLIENDKLRAEIARLRGVKRPASEAMESMSTKLKEALRE